MGQIRKVNGVYYIEFHARGLLYSQMAGGDLEQAQRLLFQVEEKIAHGEALTIDRHIDLADFFGRFIDEIQKQQSSRTVGRFAAAIEHFSGFLKSDFPQVVRLAQISPGILESYKRCLAGALRPRVLNLTLLLIRDVLEFGITLGFINDNPCLHLRLLPWPPSRPPKETPRYVLARRLLSQGVGLARLAQLLKLTDIARCIYFADLIPLSRF
ncbi:MAG: hypothetical protein KGJ09_01890 [Candidatus Omnitrophica bacterium]|nr:hypothetical protein [Candidatus Omnitrophota bacterium]MDE2008809.1 hypothetical protein [Candidatus Omnitrophota bacterium]MDE2213628.1 hypothetical protein [Candidatus Omnitrophota bacterium]MDE2230471.1 hypothetical protein [Candidatus Omnitrophota bacterium]